MNKKLFAGILFLMVFVMGIKVPLISKAEDAKKENSWQMALHRCWICFN